MKVERTGRQIRITMDGTIGESTVLFTMKLDGADELVLDMADVTYINSIGVKHWIMWTMRLPKSMQVKMENCPYVIASQASTVMGFVTPNMKIESFRAPFACNNCGTEDAYWAIRGTDYEYATETTPRKINLPLTRPCPKCGKGVLEPDFIAEKTLKFLS